MIGRYRNATNWKLIIEIKIKQFMNILKCASTEEKKDNVTTSSERYTAIYHHQIYSVETRTVNGILCTMRLQIVIIKTRSSISH